MRATALLLNAKCTRLLHGNGQLLKELLKRRVRRQVETIEARMSSGHSHHSMLTL